MPKEEELSVELKALSDLVKSTTGGFEGLARAVGGFGRSNPLKETMVVTLKQARDLLKAAKGNTDAVRVALKAAGVSTKDMSMLMGRLNADIDKARRSTMEFQSIWTKIFSPRTVWYASHAMNVVSKGFGALQMAMQGPMGLARGVINQGISTGKDLLDSVIDAASFRQNALTGMSYMLGGDMKKARSLFEDAQKLAQKTPLDTDKVISGIKTFLTQGFTPEESKYLYRVVADQAAKFLDRPEIEQTVVNAFSRMQGRGYATGEDLESLRAGGFRAKDVIEQLRQQQGMPEIIKKMESGGGGLEKALLARIKSGKATEEDYLSEVRHLLGTGKVGKYTLLNAATASLYAGKDRSAAGSLAEDFGQKSLTGSISNAKNAFKDLLQSMDLVETKGMKALMGFFGKYTEMLTNAEGPGKKIRDTVEGLVDALLEGLDKITPEDLTHVIDVIGETGKVVITTLREAWHWFDKLVHSDSSFLDNMKEILVQVGKFIGIGMWQGVKAAMSGATTALSPAIDARTISKYGVTDADLKALALKNNETDYDSFKQKFLKAKDAFHLAGQLSSVLPQKGETFTAAYARKIADFAGFTPLAPMLTGSSGFIPSEVPIPENSVFNDWRRISAPSAVPDKPSEDWRQMTPAAMTLEVPNSTPAFKHGGRVPGPFGQPQLAVVHGGESFSGMNGRSGGGGSPGGIVININVMGDVKDVQGFAAALRPVIAEEFRNVLDRFSEEAS